MFNQYLGYQLARWRYLWNRPESKTASAERYAEPVHMEIREYLTEEAIPYKTGNTTISYRDKHSFYVCVGPFASLDDVKSGLAQMMMEWPVRPEDTAMINNVPYYRK